MKAIKVASSSYGSRSQQTPQQGGPIAQANLLSNLQREDVESLRKRFTLLECRFLKHQAFPAWRDTLTSSGMSILAELRIAITTVVGYDQWYTTRLLNRGANIDLTDKELIELECCAKDFEEWTRVFNMICEQGLLAAQRFVRAFHMGERELMKLLEAAAI